MPKSAIIVLTYNHEKYIVEALKGIYNQTVKVDEVIIADDFSIDKTREVILDFVKENNLENKWTIIFNSSNKGINKNLQDVINLTKAEIIIPMAGDDISLPNRAEVSLKLFLLNPDLHIITTSVNKINIHSEIIGKHIYQNKLEDNIYKTIIKGTSNILAVGQAWKRSLFDKFGELPLDLPNEDDQLTFRALVDNGVFCSNIITTHYRIHDASASAWLQKKQSKKAYLSRFLEDMLVRKKHVEYWKETVLKTDRDDKIELAYILNLKIEFYEILNKLNEIVLSKRIIYLFKFFKYTGVKEKVYLLFGKNGVLFWRDLRKFLKH